MNNIPIEVKEALDKLKKSYFKHWLKDYRNGDRTPGYVAGSVNVTHLCILVDYIDSIIKENK